MSFCQSLHGCQRKIHVAFSPAQSRRGREKVRLSRRWSRIHAKARGRQETVSGQNLVLGVPGVGGVDPEAWCLCGLTPGHLQSSVVSGAQRHHAGPERTRMSEHGRCLGPWGLASSFGVSGSPGPVSWSTLTEATQLLPDQTYQPGHPRSCSKILEDLLLQTCKILCSINHGCLCRCIWGLSLVSRWGNYKACRPFRGAAQQVALVQCDWCPYKKKRLGSGQTQRDDHVRTQQEGEILQKKPTLPAPWSWTTSLQNCEKIHFCCFKSPSVWYLVMEPWQTNPQSDKWKVICHCALFVFLFWCVSTGKHLFTCLRAVCVSLYAV